jgi:hypothetical protein
MSHTAPHQKPVGKWTDGSLSLAHVVNQPEKRENQPGAMAAVSPQERDIRSW